MRLSIVSTALITAVVLSGCSFRHPGQLTGVIDALSASSPLGPLVTGRSITLTAQAAFSGNFKEPALSVVMPTGASQTIRVQAVANWAEPLFGLGIFVVPATSVQQVELKANITLERAGHYFLESMPPEGGAALRTAFEVGG